jgi:hypothetical protein
MVLMKVMFRYLHWLPGEDIGSGVQEMARFFFQGISTSFSMIYITNTYLDIFILTNEYTFSIFNNLILTGKWIDIGRILGKTV